MDLSEYFLNYFNKKKAISLVLTFFFFFFSFSLVSALQDDLTFQVNEQFDLKRPCFVNGFFCDNSFACNITILDIKGNVLIDNQAMTNRISYWNVTITQSQNNGLGFLRVIQSCNNVTLAGEDTFEIAITADGNKFQEFPNQFFVIILAFIMVCLGFLNERLRMFKHVGSILFMVMGVVTLYPGYNFINWTTLIGKALGFIFIGLGFFFLMEDSFSRKEQEETYDQEPEEESSS